MRKGLFILVFIMLSVTLLVFAGCDRAKVGDNAHTEETETTWAEADLDYIGPSALPLPETMDKTVLTEVKIPLHGAKYNRLTGPSWINPSPVVISDDQVLSLTELSPDLAVCWYLDGEFPNCAYRRPDGDWLCFLTEGSRYNDGYSAALYRDLFGYSGFYISAQRGSAYHAYDYYYFAQDGQLTLLFEGTFLDSISDFNGDGVSELLNFYHGGREASYNYRLDGDVYTVDVTSELSNHFSDWQYIAAIPDSVRNLALADSRLSSPEQTHSNILQVAYRQEEVEHYALITFTQDEMIVAILP